MKGLPISLLPPFLGIKPYISLHPIFLATIRPETCLNLPVYCFCDRFSWSLSKLRELPAPLAFWRSLKEESLILSLSLRLLDAIYTFRASQILLLKCLALPESCFRKIIIPQWTKIKHFYSQKLGFILYPLKWCLRVSQISSSQGSHSFFESENRKYRTFWFEK